MTARTYAWVPDVPDHRDYLFKLAAPTVGLPNHVDRIGLNVQIDNQGMLGSCTGNASTAAVEIVTGSPQLSRLMAYFNARAIEGTVKYDAGAMIRDAVKALATAGCCKEALWPYNIAKFKLRPPAACYRDAKLIVPLVARYERVTTLTQVKTALANGLPVIFGFSVPAFFESNQVATDGWVRMPTSSDKLRQDDRRPRGCRGRL